MTRKFRTTIAAIAAVAALAATGATGAAAAVVPVERVDVSAKAPSPETYSCAPKPGIPAYNIKATNMDCATALDVALEWSEMTRLQKCPRYLCEFGGLTCRSGSPIYFSPRVSCVAGQRRASWSVPTTLTQVAS